MYSIKIIFGKDAINKKLQNIPLSLDEELLYIKEFSFSTQKELDAFIYGINEGVGWFEIYQD